MEREMFKIYFLLRCKNNTKCIDVLNFSLLVTLLLLKLQKQHKTTPYIFQNWIYVDKEKRVQFKNLSKRKHIQFIVQECLYQKERGGKPQYFFFQFETLISWFLSLLLAKANINVQRVVLVQSKAQTQAHVRNFKKSAQLCQ